jgi:hypothetical protein
MKIENKDQIIRELAELRYQRGYSRGSMVSYLKETYELENSRAYEIIREMQTEVGKVYDETNENALVDAIEFMEKMKSKALGEGENKLALEWQKELNKVQQLHIQRMDITSGGDKITGFNIKIVRPDDIKSEEDKKEDDNKDGN